MIIKFNAEVYAIATLLKLEANRFSGSRNIAIVRWQ